MNKIYEIQFNEKMNYIDIIKNIKLLGAFSIFNEYFYLNTKIELDILKNTLKNISKIKEINDNNYLKISNDHCKNWCKDEILKIESQEFEKLNQNYLRKLNIELDFFIKLKEEGKLEEFIKNKLEKALNPEQDGGEIIDDKKSICGEKTSGQTSEQEK